MRAELTIPGQPVPKKNSQRIIVNQRTQRRQVIQSDRYREYETDSVTYLRLTYHGPRFDKPVRVACRYWLRDRRRPDLANLLEGTSDILERAGVVANDKLIDNYDGSRIMGVDKRDPRVEIEIEEVS